MAQLQESKTSQACTSWTKLRKTRQACTIPLAMPRLKQVKIRRVTSKAQEQGGIDFCFKMTLYVLFNLINLLHYLILIYLFIYLKKTQFKIFFLLSKKKS